MLATKWMCVLQLNNLETVFQIHMVYISLHIWFLIFWWFYCFGWYFLTMSLFQVFFFRKGIIGSIEKVFSRDSYVFEMIQWFWTVCFILGSVLVHVTVSVDICDFCVVFGISKYFLSRRSIFLISVSIEDDSKRLNIDFAIPYNCAQTQVLFKSCQSDFCITLGESWSH